VFPSVPHHLIQALSGTAITKRGMSRWPPVASKKFLSNFLVAKVAKI